MLSESKTYFFFQYGGYLPVWSADRDIDKTENRAGSLLSVIQWAAACQGVVWEINVSGVLPGTEKSEGKSCLLWESFCTACGAKAGTELSLDSGFRRGGWKEAPEQAI